MQRVKNPLIFIFITVLIDCIGLRIIFPVAATIIKEVSHSGNTESATYGGWLMASYAIMQFFFSPVLGGLSDRYGRKPVLLIALFGLGINYLFLAKAQTLSMLFAGRMIAGMCGASLTTCFAYVADISNEEKRAQNFGIIGAAVGLGFIIGPFLGGILSQTDTRLPFIAAAILSLVNVVYGLLILPESLKRENRRIFSIKRSNPFGSLWDFGKRKEIRPLLLILFLVFMAAQTMPSVWPFYTKELFSWNDLEIGYSIAYVGLLVAIVKGLLVKWSQKKLGSANAIISGLILNMAGLLLFGFIKEWWLVYVFALVYCLGGIAPPTLQAMISLKAAKNEQGELQGMISSLISIANIISPLLFTQLFYSYSSKGFPGMPFVVSAFIIFMSLMLFIKIGFKSKKNN